MNFIYDDGGREAAGFKGKTGDCACRAIANPPDEEKVNGLKPPLPYSYPYCPSCGEPTYSSERCVFCGQRLIREEL